MFRTRCAAIVLTVGWLTTAILVADTTPTRGTRSILDAQPAVRAMMNHDRLVALYGAPLGTDDNPATDTDTFVANFLSQNPDAFGISPQTLQFRSKATIRNGKLTVYSYVQQIEGLEVHASLVRLPVRHGSPERLRGAATLYSMRACRCISPLDRGGNQHSAGIV